VVIPITQNPLPNRSLQNAMGGRASPSNFCSHFARQRSLPLPRRLQNRRRESQYRLKGSVRVPADVRFGSKADIEAPSSDVRFKPQSEHRLSPLYSTQICVLGHMIRERNRVQLPSKARSGCALIKIQTKLGATGRDSRCNSLAGKDSEC
jgi:hypothetical protein